MPKIVCYSLAARRRLNMTEGIWDTICITNDIWSIRYDIGYLANEINN